MTARGFATRSTGTPTEAPSPATSSCTRSSRDAAIDGKARVDLRHPRARSLQAADPAHAAARRLHRPPDDALLLPVLPNTRIDPDGSTPGRAPAPTGRRARPKPADRPQSAICSTGRPSGQCRPGRLDDQRHTEACLLDVEENRLDYCAFGVSRPRSRLAEKYGSTGRRTVLRQPRLTTYLAFNHERPAFRGPGQIPLKKAINYAMDRPALPRTSATSRASAPTRSSRPRSRAREHLPARGRRLAAPRQLLRSARLKPTSSSSTRPSFRVRRRTAQALLFDLEQLGIEVEVKYCGAAVIAREDLDPRGAVRPRPERMGRDYADPANHSSSRCSPEEQQATGNVTSPISTIRGQSREPTRRTASPAAAARPRRISTAS